MMKPILKKLFFLFLGLPKVCFALQEKPWYGNLLEFNFFGRYGYSFFKKVDHAVPQITQTNFTNLVAVELDVTVPDTWNWEMELEFADSTPIAFGYQSFAFQIRKLWLDDVCGDFVSLSTGIVYRDASSRLRKALATPYHARANFEFHTSVGKEWSYDCYWTFRTYAVGAIGQGTEGSAWLRGDLYFWWNIQDCHQFRLYAKSYFGLGSDQEVQTINFPGWGDIGHQSIDLGISYRYFLGIYGNFRFDYLYRVFARSYPEHVNFFIFTYQLPFSLF